MNSFELNIPTIDYGPVVESAHISSGIDYYKPTMSQVAHEQEPNAEATFTFHNRGEQRLADYINPETLQARFDQLQENGFGQSEIDYLTELKMIDGSPVFSKDYLDYLANNELPKVQVSFNQEIDDISIETTGPWALVTFWETVVMSEVNEAYFEGYLRKNNINPFEVYDEGERRLDEKIAVLQQNPDIKFSDFGTRRHFSLRWHKHVAERLKAECPDNFIGTSNVELSNSLGLKPIGTFAHEMFMTYAGLADARGEDIRASHHKFLDVWFDKYGEELSIALTDTFGSDFFLSDFTPEQAKKWKSLRHDSGDPYEFGEKVIEFYESQGIDPNTKTIVFSDGLDIDTILSIHKHFNGKINAVFGWGTTLTNDLSIKPLNVVMKVTHVRLPETGQEASTVKLSDDEGKHTGEVENVNRYENEIFIARKGLAA